MRWQGRRESSNVEDARGMGMPGGGPVMLSGTGIVILLLVSLLTHTNPLKLLDQIQQQGGAGTQATDSGQPYQESPHEKELREFAQTVLADTEDFWAEQFKQIGRTYTPPTMKLFTGQIDSACGAASAAVGPFYCPGDQKVYLDLSFMDQLSTQLGANGDFAQAYVVAHEVGHHVQKLLGVSDKVDEMRQHMSEKQYNALSVRVELQADFYAGMLAKYEEQKGFLQPGDIEEALNAASQIGDDKLQEESQGRVVPDSFTHGTSAQRVRWFKRGYDTGDMKAGDTFNAKTL